MGGVGKVRSKSSRLDATRHVNLILQWKSLRWSNRHNACEKCGTNPGGVYQDKNGRRFYVKSLESPAHARNEIMAAKLYQLAGRRR